MQNISLHCLAGPLKGHSFPLQGGPVFLFGRYAKATFSLAADPAISHLHFLIDISENRIRIVDLGSTNGLVVNDKHMGGKQGSSTRKFVELKSGDNVLAGSCLFRLSITDNDNPQLPESGQFPTRPGEETEPGRLTAIMGKEVVQNRLNQHTEEDRPQKEGLPVVPGFTIIEKIAGGGKGVVYKAVKDDTGAAAAIKMLNFARVKRQRSIEMFRREIIITQQLQHPNIIRYLGDGLSEGSPYLAIEYVDGGTLDELITASPGKRMDMPQAVPLFIQLLEAVSYMHGLSLVHRDIKPKNILLDLRRGGSLAVKLSDMGLSCRISGQNVSEFLPIVSEGGTPAYMPPEQLTDLTRAIPESDVFSSAATFYHMVTGALLYDFTDRDQNETILDGNIKPILELRPDLPHPVAEVITKCLSYTPENRYANAQEMLEAFKAALIL